MTYKKDRRTWSSLASLGVGESAVVRGIRDGGRGIGDRLSSLGFSDGCTVCCVGRSFMGGMRAYSVRGAVIALRDEDAEAVITEEGEADCEEYP